MFDFKIVNQVVRGIPLPKNVELVASDGLVAFRLLHSDDIEIRLRHRIARKRFSMTQIPWNGNLEKFVHAAALAIKIEADNLSKTPRHMLFASVHGVVNDEYNFVAPWYVKIIVDDSITGRESTQAVLEFGDDLEGAKELANSLCFWPEVRNVSTC